MNKLGRWKIVSILVLNWTLAAQSAPNDSAKGKCVNGDCKSGFGKMVWAEGQQKGVCPGITYEGYFKDGAANGFGKLTYPCTGVVYFGEFNNGLQEGFGTSRWPSGEGYTGEWRHGSPAGTGFKHGTKGDLRITRGHSEIGLTLLPNGDLDRDDIYDLHPTKVGASEKDIYIPPDLESALKELKKMLRPELLEKMRKGTEEGMIEYHFGLGMWMRNIWGLWSGSDLAKWFNSHGVKHPDEMSGVILSSLWRDLNGKPLDLDKQLKQASE